MAKPRNPVEAPVDQTEFYRHYYPYAINFVIKFGAIKPDDAPDVVHSIWVRLLATDALGQFNPAYESEHDGRVYGARFEKFLCAKLDLYVRHYRAVQNKRRREIPISNEPDRVSIFDMLLGTDDADLFNGLEEELLISRVANYLRRVPKRRPSDKLELERLWLQVVAHVRFDGKVHVKELAAQLAVTDTCLKSWLKVLSKHARAAIEGAEPPLPPQVVRTVVTPDTLIMFGGTKVTVADISLGLETLRASGSNMIKQPLAAAKNPLAICDYHGVCSSYRNSVPEFTPINVGLGVGKSMGEKETFMAALADTVARLQGDD